MTFESLHSWRRTHWIILMVLVVATCGCRASAGNRPVRLDRATDLAPIQLAYSSKMLDEPSAERRPGGTDIEVKPVHWAIVFGRSYADDWPGYRQTSNLSVRPELLIFESEAYRRISDEAGRRIAQLQVLLSDKPDGPYQDLPMLPMPNGQQVFAIQARYITFDGGAGVRFVTQYAQEARHVNNQEVFYTFQGLGHDGQSYVSAFFPVRSSILPPANCVKADGSDAPRFRQETNLDRVVPLLEKMTSGEFEPSLAVLDAIVQSIVLR